ncbi:MerR family transcriptional regulator [Clostridioides mangenotii]|uniref:MerR family transcriptional regulator n=2 Tax=Metaclostridioides mangenotii TaxID=1540 RepID=UPI002149AE07|nr:MerR family transcriptional regulator [Clostridioides mangenotii]MCR1953862.1 MerR family transcriptional regulator [Clostridioides mangenotii]
MFKIGEFSKLTQVSIRMLRYYDEMDVFKPLKVDESTGYRMYSVDQIPKLQKVILLRDMKFNIDEIKYALDNWDQTYIIDKLNQKKQDIQIHIIEEQGRVNRIDRAVDNILNNNLHVNYNIVFKQIPSYSILSLREVIPNYFCEGLLWKKMYDFVLRENIEVINKPEHNIAIYHDEEYKDEGVDVEIGVVVKKRGLNLERFIYRETEAIDLMACSMVYGAYENIAPAFQSFAYWLSRNEEYKMLGKSRQICHKGPHNEMDIDKYLTEIQIPVKRL